MEWTRTLLWVVRGSAKGLLVFLLLVVAAYALVPLETTNADTAATARFGQSDMAMPT